METKSYAHEKSESATEYRERLSRIHKPDQHAMRAAKVIVAGLETGLYDPKRDDSLQKAYNLINSALKERDKLVALTEVDDRLMSAAVSAANAKVGSRIGIRGARNLIAGSATNNLDNVLFKALNQAWREIKLMAGFGADAQNISAKNIYKALKEMDVPDNEMAAIAEIGELRDQLKPSRGK